MALDVIVGLQRGDEGKGRFVDLVSDHYTVIARGNGGSNAGHTLMPDTLEPLALHQVPSGISRPGKLNIIGNGVYVDPRRLVNELADVREAGFEVSPKNLLVSDSAHLVLPHHIYLDSLRENSLKAQGSTRSGISYVASDKYLREGVRLENIWHPEILKERALYGMNLYNEKVPDSQKKSKAEIEEIVDDWLVSVESLKPYLADTVEIINDRLHQGEMVLAEGAQAFWLDINHGMYPSVTSSSTTVAGLLDGLGVSAKHLGKVTGVAKSVKSHVGGGPFVTEITDTKLAENIRGTFGLADSEFGATTKRPRRIGYPDLVELRNAIRINGVDELAVSKLDHVPRYGSSVNIATSYNHKNLNRITAPTSALALADCTPNYVVLPTWAHDISEVREFKHLPDEAKAFINLFEKELGVPVIEVGVGPGRSQVIRREGSR
ncbi:MAG: adenylosuccinate synthetase [Candidatus Saccharimonadales bacterium]